MSTIDVGAGVSARTVRAATLTNVCAERLRVPSEALPFLPETPSVQQQGEA